jgi:hypothetical protein
MSVMELFCHLKSQRLAALETKWNHFVRRFQLLCCVANKTTSVRVALNPNFSQHSKRNGVGLNSIDHESKCFCCQTNKDEVSFVPLFCLFFQFFAVQQAKWISFRTKHIISTFMSKVVSYLLETPTLDCANS